jgi:hypothetical protein
VPVQALTHFRHVGMVQLGHLGDGFVQEPFIDLSVAYLADAQVGNLECIGDPGTILREGIVQFCQAQRLSLSLAQLVLGFRCALFLPQGIRLAFHGEGKVGTVFQLAPQGL